MTPRPPRSTLFPYTTLFRSSLLNTPEKEAAAIRQAKRSLLTSLRRSEEHTSELQSRGHLVCRLLLEKKKNTAEGQIREHWNWLSRLHRQAVLADVNDDRWQR